jgi:hypothetical protein
VFPARVVDTPRSQGGETSKQSQVSPGISHNRLQNLNSITAVPENFVHNDVAPSPRHALPRKPRGLWRLSTSKSPSNGEESILQGGKTTPQPLIDACNSQTSASRREPCTGKTPIRSVPRDGIESDASDRRESRSTMSGGRVHEGDLAYQGIQAGQSLPCGTPATPEQPPPARRAPREAARMRLSRGLHEKDATIGSLLRETFRDGIVENAGGNDLIAADAGSWPYTCWELFVSPCRTVAKNCEGSQAGSTRVDSTVAAMQGLANSQAETCEEAPLHPRILKLQPHLAAREPEEGSPAHFPGHLPFPSSDRSESGTNSDDVQNCTQGALLPAKGLDGSSLHEVTIPHSCGVDKIWQCWTVRSRFSEGVFRVGRECTHASFRN